MPYDSDRSLPFYSMEALYLQTPPLIYCDRISPVIGTRIEIEVPRLITSIACLFVIKVSNQSLGFLIFSAVALQKSFDSLLVAMLIISTT